MCFGTYILEMRHLKEASATFGLRLGIEHTSEEDSSEILQDGVKVGLFPALVFFKKLHFLRLQLVRLAIH